MNDKKEIWFLILLNALGIAAGALIGYNARVAIRVTDESVPAVVDTEHVACGCNQAGCVCGIHCDCEQLKKEYNALLQENEERRKLIDWFQRNSNIKVDVKPGSNKPGAVGPPPDIGSLPK